MKKTVLISGASGNLGFAVTRQLLESGYHIIALDKAEPHEDFLGHQRFLPIQVDLMDESAVYAFVEGLQTELDAAILTVGGYAPGNFRDTPGETLHRMFRLNFETAYYLVRPLVDRFINKGKGQFVLIGARPALDPESGEKMVPYVLSKSLVFTLSDLINAAGKGTAVHSTVIVPSTLDTPENRQSMPNADFSSWVPTKHVAKTIDFLLSEAGADMREGVIKMYNRS